MGEEEEVEKREEEAEVRSLRLGMLMEVDIFSDGMCGSE